MSKSGGKMQHKSQFNIRQAAAAKVLLHVVQLNTQSRLGELEMKPLSSIYIQAFWVEKGQMLENQASTTLHIWGRKN